MPAATRFISVVLALLAVGTGAAAQERAATVPDWLARYLANEPRGQKFAHAWIARSHELRALARAAQDQVPAPPPGRYSLKGTFRVAVLAGTFSDVVPRYSPTQYASAFFGAGGTGPYTLSQYFSEASGGAFTFAGTVTDWVTVAGTRLYYVGTSPSTDRGRFVEYLAAVLDKTDGAVDWTQYDNDGPDGIPNSGDDDGYVDMVVFLHPLADGVCRSDAQAGFMGTGFRLSRLFGQPYETHSVGANGQLLKVDDFVLSAGLDCNGASIAPMNINVHEMGHALGLPDLNDLDRSSYGVGVWDVMGYGLYALPGRPAQLGAWSRRQLGWAYETVLDRNQTVTLPAVELSHQILRIPVPNTHEYYLLENRRRILADAGLPGEGLVVWHVDEDVLLPQLPNYRGTEDENHSGLAVVQADGLRNLEADRNVGDAGDPFPGSAGKTWLSDAGVPSLLGNLGAPSGATLADITPSGDDVSFAYTTAAGILARIEITASGAHLLPGGTMQLSVSGSDFLGSAVPLPPVTWSSSAPAVAAIDADGEARALALGRAIIRAQAGELSDSTAIEVVGPVTLAAQTLPFAVLGRSYAASVAASGGAVPYHFVALDSLPRGLQLTGAGVVSGDPAALGSVTFRVAVTDSLGQQTQAPVTISTAMPALAKAAVLEALTGGAPLSDGDAHALDLAGNRNGSLDVGDVLFFLKRLRSQPGGSP